MVNRKLEILYINLGDIGIYTYDKPAGRILGWAKEENFVNVLIAKISCEIVEKEILKKDPLHLKIMTLPFSGKTADTARKIIIAYLLRVVFAPAVLFKKLPVFDFAFSNSSFFVDIMPILWLKLFGRCKHWILMMDSVVPPPKERRGNSIINFLTYFESILVGRIAHVFADLIFTVNPELKTEMINRGINKEKIFLSQNGLFMDRINSTENPEKKRYEAVYMGRISIDKGVLDLIEIWKKVIIKRPKAKLAILGTGVDNIVKKFKKEIEKNNLEKNIEYLGFTPSDRKYEVLKNSKVFLYLSKVSKDESWGISLMEALACGLPAISYDLPIYEHIYKTESLIRVKLNDLDSVVERLIYLLENQKARLLLSKKAINFANTFDWFKIAEKDLRKIEEVVYSSND